MQQSVVLGLNSTCCIGGGDEVDVSVTERPAGGGVPADADGGEALELGEGLEKEAVGDVRVEVPDVERRRRGGGGGGDRRWGRHCSSLPCPALPVDRGENPNGGESQREKDNPIQGKRQ